MALAQLLGMPYLPPLKRHARVVQQRTCTDHPWRSWHPVLDGSIVPSKCRIPYGNHLPLLMAYGRNSEICPSLLTSLHNKLAVSASCRLHSFKNDQDNLLYSLKVAGSTDPRMCLSSWPKKAGVRFEQLHDLIQQNSSIISIRLKLLFRITV